MLGNGWVWGLRILRGFRILSVVNQEAGSEQTRAENATNYSPSIVWLNRSADLPDCGNEKKN